MKSQIVLHKHEVLVPSKSVVSLGSAIFAFLAAGTFHTVEEAQEKIFPPHKIFEPDSFEQRVYDRPYNLYSKIYSEFGQPKSGGFGEVLPMSIGLSVSQTRVGEAGFYGEGHATRDSLDSSKR